MSTRKLKNISPSELRVFLKKHECKCTRTKGGHEHWTRSDLNRPLTFSSHTDPVPEFVVKNLLRLMGLEKEDFFN